MKLVQAAEADFDTAMSMINMAKIHLKEQGIDQWQNGYPDEACIRTDLTKGKGFFYVDEHGEKIGYVCIDFDGEPAYEELNGTWNTEKPYVVAHRMAFSDQARGKGASMEAFRLIADYALEKGIHSFRVDTDEDNQKMKHILAKNGFSYCGTIWFDNSVKIAFDRKI